MSSSIIYLFSIIILVLIPGGNSQQPCQLGKFLKNTGCEKCPPGTFQDETGATSCKPCPAGHYSSVHGIQGIDLCLPCPIGTFNPLKGSTSRSACKACLPGTNAREGSSKCISCPPGTFISNCGKQPNLDIFNDFRGTCYDCFLGNLGVTCDPVLPVSPICQRCGGRNFFPISTRNSLSCEKCPDGTFFDESISECKTEPTSCPPGRDLLDGRCQKCTFFQFNDGTFDGCRTCPDGSQGNAMTGSTRCDPCPPGTFKRMTQDDHCLPCRKGENSFVTGARYCFNDNLEKCPPGFFKSENGACLKCTVFERYEPRKKTCVSCPKNALSEGGLSRICKKCGIGMITSSQYKRCVCEPGWGFVLGSNGSKCEKCAPGSANNDAAGICVKCGKNLIAPFAGSSQCIPCPDGTEQPREGQRKCVTKLPCEKGLIVRELFEGCVEPETNCPPKHRRIVVSGFLPACEPISSSDCPLGTAPILSGPLQTFLTCMSCFRGNKYDPEQMRCVPCGKNEVSKGSVERTCTKCQKGTISIDNECRCADGRQFLRGQCVKCPRGTFGFRKVDGCVPCPAGSFSEGGDIEDCQLCPAGTFTNQPGQNRCTPCLTGMTSFGFGETGCVPKL